MTVYLPAPHPDELLGSVVARYFAHTGGASGVVTRSRMFGQPLTSMVALPRDLPGLLRRTNLDVDPATFARRHTVLPYLVAFAEPAERATCDAYVMGDADVGVRQRMIGWPTFLRHCMTCVTADLALLGETYWRRHHQLPGVLVCAEHGDPLLTTGARCRADPARGLPDATAWISSAAESEAGSIELSPALALEFSRRSVAIMDGEAGEWGSWPWPDGYRKAAVRRGLALDHSRCDVSAVKELVQAKFGKDVLRRICGGSSDPSDKWVSEFFRTSRVTSRGLGVAKHVIVQLTLEGAPEVSATELVSERGAGTPFPPGPWICPNPAVGHVGPTVASVVVSPYSKVPTAIGECACGMRFSFRPHPTSPSLPVPTIMHNFPMSLVEHVRGLARHGVTKSEIGRRLALKRKCVYRLLADDYAPGPTSAEVRDVRRARWLDLMATPEVGSYGFAARMDDPLYQMLLLNDRDWLMGLDRRTVRRSTTRRGVDWPERDRQVHAALVRADARLRDKGFGPRRTAKALLGSAGLSLSLMKHLEARARLPSSAAFLRSAVEGVDAHHERKLRTAADRLARDGVRVTEWRLRAMTSLQGPLKARGVHFHELIARLTSPPP